MGKPLAYPRHIGKPKCDQQVKYSHGYLGKLLYNMSVSMLAGTYGIAMADTSNTRANMSSGIMMSIKSIITGSYMFIDGSVLLSKRA